MTIQRINRHILSEYPERFHAKSAVRLDPSCSLGSCRYWRIRTSEEQFCLRRWPEKKPEKERMQFVQAVLWHAVYEGIDFAPLPFETLENKGFIEHDGRYWELLPWISGHAEPATEASVGPFPGAGRELKMFQTVSAMMSLAQFHQAVSTFPLPNPPLAASPGMCDDLAKWKTWIDGGFSHLFQALRSSAEARLAEFGLTLLNQAVRKAESRIMQLTRNARHAVPIQPVIGNAHARHLRFDADGVCGILDLKEIGIDNVVSDIATLLGSLAEADPVLWHLGIRAYRQIRSLSDSEMGLLEAFDQSRVFLEGLDYLDRVFLQGETCNEWQIREMIFRLDRILARLDGDRRNRYSA